MEIMGLKKPMGKSWGYWWAKMMDDLTPKRVLVCRRHSWVLIHEDKLLGKKTYECEECGRIAHKYPKRRH
jgi:hypothetical protein